MRVNCVNVHGAHGRVTGTVSEPSATRHGLAQGGAGEYGGKADLAGSKQNVNLTTNCISYSVTFQIYLLHKAR